MKKITLILGIVLLIGVLNIVEGQNIAITDDNAYTANNSAMLDVKSLTKGLLVPRLTSAQRNAISLPATGLLVFDTNENVFYYYTGSIWSNLSVGQLWTKNGNYVYLSNTDDNVGIGVTSPNNKLLVKADASTGVDESIFAVLNNNGDTVFAVYPEGVRIWVNDAGGTKANGSRGGFAVGGFNPAKAGFTNEYLRVTPDSVRVYIDDNYVSAKANGSRGGFAVGGFNPTKGSLSDNYLFVQDDSTRVYVTGDEGFAVDNIEASATEGRYMDLTPSNYLIGHHSGDIITGLYNSFFGYETGLVSTSAYRNIFIGYQAGYDNTTADENNFIGYQAGFNNTTGNRNNFIGYRAGYTNSTGIRNTFVGTGAGFGNVDGNYNSLYGYYSGYAATLDNNNVIMGYYSGYDADNANSCVMIGSNSGMYADNSTDCVFLGTSAGFNNNIGNNVFIGTESGYANTTGQYNVFIGYNAGNNNTTASNLTGIGNNALLSNTTGEDNTAVGEGTLESNTTGARNIATGSCALKMLITGNNNAAYGAGALRNNNGSDNTAIGYLAGYNATGSGCVLIGRYAGYNETNSNRLYIDNSSTTSPLIYGQFDNNRVGINDGAPSANLHIKQYGTGEEGFAIENDGTTSTWSWEIGTNFLNLAFNGTNVGYWNNASGAYIATSDKTLKKDIVIENEPVLNKVLKLELVSYRLNHADPNSQKIIGFIAQDVQTLFPEIIQHNENGNLGLNYDDFGILSIKAIQEQQLMIEELKEEIKILHNEIKILKTK